jgi:phage-related protein
LYTATVLEKPLCWLGSSLEDVRAFPDNARRAAGYQLGRVQQGLLPSDWKPMPTVGVGVYEIVLARNRLGDLLARRARRQESP